MLVVGAGLLWLAERWGSRTRGLEAMTRADAAIIGAAQAIALFPGISRSGITIAAGLFLGLEREAAARFSFLMAVPVIAGAGLWKARSARRRRPRGAQVGELVVGVAHVGYLRVRRDRVPAALPARPRHGIFIAYRIVARGRGRRVLLSR